MWKALGRLVLVASVLLASASAALATDLETPKPERKAHRTHQHYPARLKLPGPVRSMRVTRGPTCGAWFARYPNYAQASCRDYEGVLTAYDPRDPTGVGVYGFRAYYGLR
jgi:hypothetical protein